MIAWVLLLAFAMPARAEPEEPVSRTDPEEPDARRESTSGAESEESGVRADTDMSSRPIASTPADTASLALGPPPAPPRPALDRSTSRWYGGPIILADLAILLTSGPTVLRSLLAYPAAGPIVHGLHGRPKIAVLSLSLRLGLTVGGATLAASRAPEDEGPIPSGIFATLGGLLLGMVAATTIDAALLSTEPAPNEEARPSRVVIPSATMTEDGFVLGLGGSF